MIKVPNSYRWVALVLAVVFQAATFGFMKFCFTFWVEPWNQEFGVAVTRIMLISSAMMFVMGGFSAVIGRVFDRFPASHVVGFGLLIFAITLWLGSLAQTFVQIFVIYAIMLPFATSMTGTLASQSVAVKWFNGHNQLGLAIGIAAMGISVGGAITPPLVAIGLTEHDWRWVFQSASMLLGLGLAPIMFLLLMPRPPSSAEGETRPDGSRGLARTESANKAIPLPTLLTSRYFWIPVVALFLDYVAYSGFSYNAASYMKSINFGLTETASVVSILAMVMLFTKPLMGKLTDWFHYKTLFTMAALCNCAGLAIFALGIPNLVLLGAVLLGLGAGGLVPLQARIISFHFGAEHFAQVFGFFIFLQMMGVLGSPLLSYLHDIFGSYRQPFLIMIGFVVVAIALIWTLRSEKNVVVPA